MKLGWFVALAAVATAHAEPTAKPDDAKPETTTRDAAKHKADVAPAAKLEGSLDAFRKALANQRAGKSDHPLRVAWFGDSLTADDHITHALRTRLQALAGDGGPGFVFAAPPHPFCQHRACARVVSDGWIAHGVSTVVPPDHLLGLGGDAETDEGGTIKLVPTTPVASIDIHYLAQPHGGKLDLVADGKLVASIATSGEQKASAFTTQTLPEGTKRIELRARGRVRLFGASLESKAGAVVDNLGVVNATAKSMQTHDLDDHLRNQLAHRNADLIVVMYGTNEAEWIPAKGQAMAEHEKLFGQLLATIRAASPNASCLVISPLDQLDYKDETMPPRESIPAMVDAQRRAATANGCAFWDVYTWMGGKGASRSWYKRGLVVKDFQHPTSEGAERIADALYRGLVAQ